MPGRTKWRTMMAGLLLAFATASGAAELTVPDDGNFVIDRAGLVDPAVKQKLETWLKELEQKTTAQVKLLTVPTTGGEDVFGFGQRHAELWKLGQQGKDNGALIVLAVQEREVRTFTGYGLEGPLPDSWCGSASREVAGKYFKQGQYSQGLDELVTMVVHRVAADAGVTIQGVPKRQLAPGGGAGGGWCFIIFIVVIVLLNTFLGGRRGSRSWGRGMVSGGSSFGGGRSFGGGGGSFGGGGRFGGGGGGARW